MSLPASSQSAPAPAADPGAPSILLVDDDEQLLAALSRLLRRRGYRVDTATGAGAAVPMLSAGRYDIVVSDIRMPEMDGHELLRIARRECPNAEIIMLTGYGTIESAVQAMRDGAFDYLTKPPNPDELLLTLKRIEELRGLRERNLALQRELSGREASAELIGEHPVMVALYDLIRAVAQRDVTALICGESGSGKELIARAIHRGSRRSEGPFVVVNCAALAGELLENELFGHEKGAFTDATERAAGKLEVADGGTVFLDEVGAMGEPLQQRFLRFLEDRRVERLGGTRSIEVDVRVVAATNSDLEEMIAQRRFRDDLYYRLNVVRIDAPPLRDHRSDIPALAHHFLARANADGGGPQRISQEALQALESYDWPGNVRQLINAVERARVVARGPAIELEHLPPEIRGEGRPASGRAGLKQRLDATERQLIAEALREHGGNRTRAAEALQVNRTTLLEKMRKHGLGGG